MTAPSPGAVAGGPKLLLRLEGVAVLGLALYLYTRGQFSWVLFAGLILVPDVSLVAYLAGPRVGAAAYNALHSYVGPIVKYPSAFGDTHLGRVGRAPEA